MRNNTINLQRIIIILVLSAIMFCLWQQPTIAQDTYPPRAIRADEMITLDRSLPLKTALDILGQYSMRHEGKIIINTSGKNMPINVLVNNMYWKSALEYILRSNLLKYEEKEKYYEIVPLIETKKDAAGGNEINTQTREIEINAIFFEADYGTLSELGVDWSVIKDGRVRVSGSFSGTETQNALKAQFSRNYKSYDVFALLQAFESTNNGEVIANPQIKVLDGETGKIKVGTNFFLTTEDFAGNTRFTEYEAGVILTVKPVVIGTPDSLFVHLNIDAERSNVVPDVQAVTKSITESKTQVLLLNGEETAIAGLFSNSVTDKRIGIPLLKDLPPWFFGLRYLFGFNSTDVRKKELIIILQANILPTVAERIAARAMNKRIYIDQKRQEFLRRMQQLKLKNNASNTTNGKVVRKRRP